ncbi:MAG TPA: hypothetical protein DEP84_33940 [Chloroflexi bacterium]|nr:hypothetical protein [Chloroflexota bacterium]
MNRTAFSGTALRILLAVLLVTALLAAVLVACGRTSIQPLSNFPETMSVWFQWETPPAARQAMFDQFGDAHNTLVEVVSRADLTRFTDGPAREEPPDMIVFEDSWPIGTWVRNGWLIPLDDVIAASGIDLTDIPPEALDQCRYLGKYYCLPWGVDVYALYWNKDLFRTAGLDPHKPPETLEELFEYSKKLTKFDEAGNLLQAGFIPTYPWGFLEFYAHVFGGYWLNDDVTQVTLSSRAVVDALQWERQYYAMYGPEALDAFVASFGDYFSPENGFLAGKVAMMLDGQWVIGPEFMGVYSPGLDYGVAPFPYPADHPQRKDINVLTGEVVAIPAGVKNVGAAGTLLAWMLSPETVAGYLCEVYSLPTSIKAAADPCFQRDDNFRVFMQLMNSPNVTGLTFSTIDVSEELGPIEKAVLHQGVDPVPLLREAEAKLQRRLAEVVCTTEECVRELTQLSATRAAQDSSQVAGAPAVGTQEAGATATPTVTPEPEEPAAPEEALKTVTVTFLQEPDSLNPLYTQMWFASAAIDLFDVGLWTINEQLQTNLEMAAEMPTRENGGISEDGKVITIELREDVRWSDGTPVTARDFVFTYEMIMAESNTVQTTYPYKSYAESVTALDDYTLQIVLREPFVGWSTGFFPVVLPRHILEPVFQAEGTIDHADWNRNPTVGNGAFVFNQWEAGSQIVLEANPNYWRGRPTIDRILIRMVPDSKAQMALIQAGETDLGTFMTAADKPAIDQLEEMTLVMAPSPWMESWFFNLDPETGHPALQDVHVRQALAMAVDRQQMINTLFYGMYKIPATFWPGTRYEDPSMEPWPYDPEQAKALLDQAGWVDSNGDGVRDRDGVELVLRYLTTDGNEVRQATQETVKQMLAEVGIGVEILNYSPDIFWNSYGDNGPIARGAYDIAQWSDGAYDYPDPNWPYLLCSEIPGDDNPDGLNWFGICDPELDQLLQEQAVTIDAEQRIQLFYQIERIMHEQVYWFGLRTDPDLWAVNSNLRNLRLSGVDAFWNAYEWDTRPLSKR